MIISTISVAVLAFAAQARSTNKVSSIALEENATFAIIENMEWRGGVFSHKLQSASSEPAPARTTPMKMFVSVFRLVRILLAEASALLAVTVDDLDRQRPWMRLMQLRATSEQ